jgi:hypothetical protein
MIRVAIGTIWILLGVWWAIRPNALKARLKRKMNRRIRFTVFLFALVFGIMMVGSVFNAPGLLYKVVGIAGLIISIKVIMVLTSRASERVLTWLGERPVMFFRVWAIIFIVMGSAMLAAV